MQSSTNNLYLPEEFPDDFLYHRDDENDFHGTIDDMKSGFTGLEIKGKVRTLSPVLFYQINIRYLMMSNNELKYLPAGK
jgi:hypothetical protein